MTYPPGLATGRLAMGHRDAVPAGIYARQWLEAAGLWDEVKDRLAETDNVRAALALVARGAVPLGIVYASDAVAEPAVKVLWHAPASDSRHHRLSRLLPSHLRARHSCTRSASPQAGLIFTAHGFQRGDPMTSDAAAWEALRLSLWVACWATVLAVPLALWVAWLLARRDFWGKSAAQRAGASAAGPAAGGHRLSAVDRLWPQRTVGPGAWTAIG